MPKTKKQVEPLFGSQAGVVFRAYSAVELEDEQEDAEAPQ